MLNNLLTVLFLATVATVIFFIMFREKPDGARSAKSPGRAQAPPREHMLQILLSPGGACKAAQDLESHFFYKNNAPTLPLPNCQNSTACRCRFQMVSDRRLADRRVGADKRDSIRFEDNPRRDGRGRRDSDTLFDHKTK